MDMLLKQHTGYSRMRISSAVPVAPCRPTAAAFRRSSHITCVARPTCNSSSSGAMLRPGKGKVSDAAVETLQTAKPAVDGTADGDVAQKDYDGSNLAQWLVNKPETVKDELESYSQGFLQFWRKERAAYWPMVEKKKKDYGVKQKEEDKRANALNDPVADAVFIQPKLPQRTTAEYAEKAFVKEVVKYGEMVQAVYDTLETKDVYSRFFGGCMAGAMEENSTLAANNGEFINVGEAAAKYTIEKQMQADSGAYKLVTKEGRNYVGFIATGPAHADQPDDSNEVDIAVVFRGTITKDEWFQDAKVLQVRWNNGSAVAQPPRIFLRAWPFQPTAAAFTGTLALSLLLLWGFKAHTGALPAGVAGVDAWVKAQLSTGTAAGSANGFLQGLIASSAGFLQTLLGITVNADTGPLPFSVALAAGAWMASGFIQARIAHPNHWFQDMRSLVMALPLWVTYGVQLLSDTLVSSFAGLKGDPLVSYGFKQMYSDAKEHEASPRLTIMTTLTELLEDYRKQGKVVRSIHVTGHSLGGALASLCAYDLSTTVAAALQAADDPLTSNKCTQLKNDLAALQQQLSPQERLKLEQQLLKKGETELSIKSALQRIELMSQLWHIKQQQGNDAVPVVAGITFAAPRVGNPAYANAFKARSLIDPLSVKEPLLDSKYKDSMVGRLGAVFRDRIWLLLKHIWYNVGVADIAKEGAAVNPDDAGGMLRVVNVHDVVPDAPSAVRVPFFRYVHGGQELLVNSLHVPYYRAGDFTGAAIGARHNLEQYLHTLDPTRDQALVNKSDDVLLSSYRVPKCWWSPVPNRGMVHANVDGRGTWMRKEALEDQKKQ